MLPSHKPDNAQPGTASSAQGTLESALPASDVLRARLATMMGAQETAGRDPRSATVGSSQIPANELAMKIAGVSTQVGQGNQHDAATLSQMTLRVPAGQVVTQAYLDHLARLLVIGNLGGPLGKTGEPFSGLSSHQTGHPHPSSSRHGTHPAETPLIARDSPSYPKQPSLPRVENDTRAIESVPREIVRPTLSVKEGQKEELPQIALPKGAQGLQDRPVDREPRTVVAPDSPPQAKPYDGPSTPAMATTPELQRTPEQLPTRDPSPIVTQAIQAAINDARNQSARTIQQILAAEPLSRPPVPDSTTTSSEQLRPLDPSFYSTRQSVELKLEQLRDHLQTIVEATTPRQRPEDPSSLHIPGSATQAVGDFSKAGLPLQSPHPIHDAQRADRSAGDSNPLPFVALREVGNPSLERIPGAAMRAEGELNRSERSVTTETTAQSLAKILKDNSLMDAISKATERIINIGNLKKIEATLDTTVIAAAAAVTLGVIGAEALTKKLLECSKELLQLLREENVESSSLEKAIEQIERIDEMCHDRDVEKVENQAEMVADITGDIIHSGTGLPVEGVIVDGGTMGMTFTDTFGRFQFQNVPLDSGFHIQFIDHRHTFDPTTLLGTVSAVNHFTVTATKVEQAQ